jgi:alpha-1,2-mannosyltransferase
VKTSVDWTRVSLKVVTVAPAFLIAAYVVKWIVQLIAGHQVMGGDFRYYWATASLVRAGHASNAYDFQKFQEFLQSTIGSPFPVAWFYPPTFLLVLFPLSFLPYPVAFVVWIATTLGALCFVVYRIVPHRPTVWLLLSFPAVFLNIDYGQNGFLSAALLGGGLVLLSRSPVLAGVLFGLLTFKPHLVVLVPIALLAGRQWRALFSLLLTFLAIVILTSVVFGPHIWIEFIESLTVAGRIIGGGYQGQLQSWGKMVSIYSALRLIGSGPFPAWSIQALAMICCCAIVAWVWYREATSFQMRASVLVLGTLLFSPHVFEYDLTLLSLPLAWICWDGLNSEWRPGERVFLPVVWLSPLFYAGIVRVVGIQLAPFLPVVFLVFSLRRGVKFTPKR